jgi:thiol-disulfide isomerase/thioredoxin
MTEMSITAPLRTLRPLILVAAIALLMAGCGASGQPGDASGDLNYDQALAGAPPPLAALYKQPNKLLDGGVDAFRKQLDDLHGHPVVVNKWASWCGPCRFEFPSLQRLSAKFGKQVAFFGVNSDDSEDAASTFLSEFPVPYPSYNDPDEDIAAEMKATLGFPSTAFYDRSGKLVYLKQGPYTSDADFAADIQRYALGSEG